MTTRSSLVLLGALLVAILSPVSRARAADQVVSDCGDSGGANQLRAKITAAQSSGGGTITIKLNTVSGFSTGERIAIHTALNGTMSSRAVSGRNMRSG